MTLKLAKKKQKTGCYKWNLLSKQLVQFGVLSIKNFPFIRVT